MDRNNPLEGPSSLQQKVYQSCSYFGQDSASHVKIVTIANNTELLLEAILCGRCDRIPIPPRVAVCTEGHLMCARCIRIIGPSPRCHKEIEFTDSSSTIQCGESLRRYSSQMYDYLYNNSLFRCANAVHGCEQTFMGSRLRKHERNCPYRPALACPFTSCHSGLIPKPNYVQHLTTSHDVVLFMSYSSRIQALDDPMNNDIPAETPHYRWLCAVINCFDLSFMLMAEEDSGSLFIWISLASDENLVNGRKYQCTLAMVPDKSSIQLSSKGVSWEGDVYPFEKSFDDIVTNEDSLLITRASLTKRYISNAGYRRIWNIDVVIKENADIVQDLAPENGILAPENGILAPHNGILVPDNGILPPDNGILLPDNGILSPDNGILAPDNGILAPDNGILVERDHGIPTDEIHEEDFGDPSTPSTSSFSSAENSQSHLEPKSLAQHLKDERAALDEELEPVASVKKYAETYFPESIPDHTTLPNIEVTVNVSPNPNPPICPDSIHQNDREEIFPLYLSPLFTPPTEPKDPMKKEGFETQILPKPKPERPIPKPRTIFPDGRRSVKTVVQLVEIKSTCKDAQEMDGSQQRILENREKARMKGDPIVKDC